MLFVFIGVAGLCLDFGNWYLQTARMQRAVDAAALAGSVHLPGDLNQAKATAAEELTRNRETPVGAQYWVNPNNPNELSVRIERTVDNSFFAFFGAATSDFMRTGTAEYRPFMPMGSPSNVLGTEPDPANSWDTLAASDDYWLSIGGGLTRKDYGDRWLSGDCKAFVDGCNTALPVPARNTEYTSAREYIVAVGPGVTGTLQIQAYDPGLYTTGNRCGEGALEGPYYTNFSGADATDPRYQIGTDNPFCAGDRFDGTVGQEASTKFELWTPAVWPGPQYPIPSGSCSAKTFPGYSGSLGSKLSSDPVFRSEFHQWVNICQLNIGGTYPAGDYVLKVSTPPDKHAQNRFALRAAFVNGAGAPDPTKSKSVAIHSKARLTLYALRKATNVEFYLTRLRTYGAGKDMIVTFFDLGDADSPVTANLVPPAEATAGGIPLSGFSECEYSPPGNTEIFTATGPTCTITGLNATSDSGKLRAMKVHIPADYTCNDTDPNGCWVKIRLNYSEGMVYDATSWEVNISGQPVRLVPAD